MAIGTGAPNATNLPSIPYVVDPATFFAETEKQEFTEAVISMPAAGNPISSKLLTVGIVSKVAIVFQGTLTISTASVTTSNIWPYGLLKDFKLSANGANDIFSCDGLDLVALRFVNYPSYSEKVDTFPGTIGGGDTIATGTYAVEMAWELPVAIDQTTLIGALFLQSSATNIQVSANVQSNTNLFATNQANAAWAGTFKIIETAFDLPYDPKGNLIIPDLSRLHGFQALNTPFTNTGDVPITLVKGNGQIERIFTSVANSATNRISAQPNAAASNKIDKFALQYGGNKNPRVYDPGSQLLRINDNHYGAPVPYDRLILDFIRENTTRDVIYEDGVTELKVIPTVNSSVSVSLGNANVRVVKETLY